MANVIDDTENRVLVLGNMDTHYGASSGLTERTP